MQTNMIVSFEISIVFNSGRTESKFWQTEHQLLPTEWVSLSSLHLANYCCSPCKQLCKPPLCVFLLMLSLPWLFTYAHISRRRCGHPVLAFLGVLIKERGVFSLFWPFLCIHTSKRREVCSPHLSSGLLQRHL